MMEVSLEGIGAGEMKGFGRERVNREKQAALKMKTQIRNLL